MSAFENPDGSFAVVAVNRTDVWQRVYVKGVTKEFTLALPPRGIASAKWSE